MGATTTTATTVATTAITTTAAPASTTINTTLAESTTTPPTDYTPMATAGTVAVTTPPAPSGLSWTMKMSSNSTGGQRFHPLQDSTRTFLCRDSCGTSAEEREEYRIQCQQKCTEEGACGALVLILKNNAVKCHLFSKDADLSATADVRFNSESWSNSRFSWP